MIQSNYSQENQISHKGLNFQVERNTDGDGKKYSLNPFLLLSSIAVSEFDQWP